jgi:hypothetical protein
VLQMSQLQRTSYQPLGPERWIPYRYSRSSVTHRVTLPMWSLSQWANKISIGFMPSASVPYTCLCFIDCTQLSEFAISFLKDSMTKEFGSPVRLRKGRFRDRCMNTLLVEALSFSAWNPCLLSSALQGQIWLFGINFSETE